MAHAFRSLVVLTALAVHAPPRADAGMPARPLQGASGVSREVAPGWHFDQPEAAAEAIDGRVELRTPVGTRVEGIVRVSRSDAVFEPKVPLAACTRYRLTLRDASRLVVARTAFTTQCSAWGAPVQIDDRRDARDPDRNAAGVALVADVPGGVVAAWFQGAPKGAGRQDVIETARERARFGDWIAPERIDAVGAGPATLPALAADGRASVIAVWAQVVDGRDAVFARRLRPDRAWGPPARLDDSVLPGDATAPQLAADAESVAVAWQQPDGRGTRIEAAVGGARGPWTRARRLDQGGDAYAPTVAALGEGGFLVAWEQARPAGVYAAIWRDGAWSAPRRVSAPGRGGHQPVAVGDGRGGAALAWIDGRGARRRIAVARLRGGAMRRVASPLQDGGAALAPALAFDPGGDLVMAWEQDISRGREAIVSARLRKGRRRWDTTVRLDAADQRSAGHPVLAADAAGNLACAWYQDGPLGLQVWVGRMEASNGRWTHASELSDPHATVQASMPALAVDSAGGITVAWQQFNGWRDVVMAARRP